MLFLLFDLLKYRYLFDWLDVERTWLSETGYVWKNHMEPLYEPVLSWNDEPQPKNTNLESPKRRFVPGSLRETLWVAWWSDLDTKKLFTEQKKKIIKYLPHPRYILAPQLFKKSLNCVCVFFKLRTKIHGWWFHANTFSHWSSALAFPVSGSQPPLPCGV